MNPEYPVKPRLVSPRGRERRSAAFFLGPPFPADTDWIWADRRKSADRRRQPPGGEGRVHELEAQWFRTLLEALPEAAQVVDHRGRIVLVNHACEHLFGYGREALLGQSVDCLLPTDGPRLRAILRSEHLGAAPGASPAGQALALSGRRQDGEKFPVEIGLRSLEIGHRRLVLVTLRDATAHHRALAALAQQKAALEADLHACRQAADDLRAANADLQKFGFIATHHLLEPLRQLRSFLELLKQRSPGKLDQEARHILGYAISATGYMGQLVNDLLTYTQVRHRRPQWPAEPIDATVPLQFALMRLRTALAESGGRVTHDVLPRVWADPEKLQLLFVQLLDNGLKFSPNEAPSVHVSATESADHWTFCVRDHGIGIAPACHERIFRLFQRLHPREAYPGTGIGLALAKGIVEQHGGRLWVESDIGHGAAFYFTLPKLPPARRES